LRLLVGLGNPGSRYVGTRHNLGFEAVDRIAREAGADWERGPSKSLVAEGTFAGQTLLLAKPLTYMNLSGRAVLELTRVRELATEELLIFIDDIALPLGALRIRERGSAGGHKGLASVLTALGNEDVPRARLGIRPRGLESGGDAEDDLSEFVLERFTADERPLVDELLERTVMATRTLLTDGMARAMSLFNRAPAELENETDEDAS
jgi:peptidyl-tRNA hydrolase, PTH1 family